MKKNIQKHVENVKKYEGSYYFSRDMANIVLKFNENTNALDVAIVSYEDSVEKREVIGSGKDIAEATKIIEGMKERVKLLNIQLKADYTQLISNLEERYSLFDDKDVSVYGALIDGEYTIGLNINKAGWLGEIVLYEGPRVAKAVKALRKGIHTGLCVRRGNKDCVQRAHGVIESNTHIN